MVNVGRQVMVTAGRNDSGHYTRLAARGGEPAGYRAKEVHVHRCANPLVRRYSRWGLKILIDDVVANRKRKEDTAQFLTNVLADLKSVYDRVGRARTLIPAHRSALTYRNEMRDLIEARVQLRNVVRALDYQVGAVDGHLEQFVQHLNQFLLQPGV